MICSYFFHLALTHLQFLDGFRRCGRARKQRISFCGDRVSQIYCGACSSTVMACGRLGAGRTLIVGRYDSAETTCQEQKKLLSCTVGCLRYSRPVVSSIERSAPHSFELQNRGSVPRRRCLQPISSSVFIAIADVLISGNPDRDGWLGFSTSGR